MTDIDKLKAASSLMIMPVHISGVVNLLAHPSPDIVKSSQPFPAKIDRVEIDLPHTYSTQVLHSDTILQNGKPTTLQVLGCTLPMPANCVVCNREAVDHGILEALGPVKLTYGKMTISGNNSTRVWDSIQRDRYWFTFPVCKDHLPDFHKHLYIKADQPKADLGLKLPNKTWAEEFITMNPVNYAVFKDEAYLKKVRWAAILLYFGILGLGIAIAMTIARAAWFWLIPTLALTVGGFLLLLKNRFKILVPEKSNDPNVNNTLPKWLEGVVSFKSLKSNLTAIGFTILVFGALALLVKFNGKTLAWQVTVGVLAVGALLSSLGLLMGKKKK